MAEHFRLWSGRSTGALAQIVLELSESISLDRELYEEDIRASQAHAKMLHKIGVLEERDFQKIQEGLRQIQREIETKQFPFDIHLEDIHTHIEKRLITICGEAGRRIHTARSRNDQIAVDTHLFVLKKSKDLGQAILNICSSLLKQAEAHRETLLPGYTHLQVAQPTRLSHHLFAYFWAFLRDVQRFSYAAQRAAELPLGSGALGGLNYPIDRELLRQELGFASIYKNSMDAVSTRDHILDFLYAATLFLSHASRLCEEIVLWHSQEFSFMSLPDHLTTGSSIMPQKKNPDLAELIRAKAARLQANLHNLLSNLKSLPMSYNRDLQEDRFPLLDGSKQSLLCARALDAMIREAQYDTKKMRAALEKGFATATDLADALVHEKNVAFRDAHHIAGQVVRHCIEKGIPLEALDAASRAKYSRHLENEDFYQKAVSLEASVEKKQSYGGSSLQSQIQQSKEAKEALAHWSAYPWPGPY